MKFSKAVSFCVLSSLGYHVTSGYQSELMWLSSFLFIVVITFVAQAVIRNFIGVTAVTAAPVSSSTWFGFAQWCVLQILHCKVAALQNVPTQKTNAQSGTTVYCFSVGFFCTFSPR